MTHGTHRVPHPFRYNQLVAGKAELQSSLIEAEESKLQVSKALLDLQIENNQLKEMYATLHCPPFPPVRLSSARCLTLLCDWRAGACQQRGPREIRPGCEAHDGRE